MAALGIATAVEVLGIELAVALAVATAVALGLVLEVAGAPLQATNATKSTEIFEVMLRGPTRQPVSRAPAKTSRSAIASNALCFLEGLRFGIVLRFTCALL